MSTIRTFIAIHLPTDVKAALDDVARHLDSRVPRGAIRWVRPEQMHLTLRFLGDTDTGKLPAIQAAMDAVAAGNTPFEMHLESVGCFPNPRRPRIIWVGLVGEDARLSALKKALDEALIPLGRPLENKPFRAHLTLGRVKDERSAAGIDWTTDVPPLALTVSALHLIESELRPNGPVYTERYVSRFSVDQ